jgi:hypothetical protein
MKFVWEESDIIGGRVVGKPARLESWMIIYRPSTTPGSRGNLYGLVSLADGSFGKDFVSKSSMAEFLNDIGEIPEEFIIREEDCDDEPCCLR